MTMTGETWKQPGQIQLDQLALRIADELAFLARLSLEVQDGLSGCITINPNDYKAIAQLQSIDRIGQGLADLRRLMTGLTDELPTGIELPAAGLRRDLRLRDLADRLVPTSGAPSLEPERTTGDILWL